MLLTKIATTRIFHGNSGYGNGGQKTHRDSHFVLGSTTIPDREPARDFPTESRDLDMSTSPGSENVGIEDRGPAVFAVTTATLVLATTFVVARLVCRQFIVKNISWDDRIIILAWFIAFGLSFTINFGARKGLGRHDADIHDEDWGTLRRCEYVFSVLYNPALMATKTSILIFYLRISRNTQKILRLASWVTLGIVNVAGTVLTFMNIFQCRPINAAWSVWEDDSKCIPLLTEFICASPVNIVTDLAILALPIPVLTGMRLPPRQKTILVLTFGLGIFVTIVDVVRIYYLQQAIWSAPTSPTNDPHSKFGQQEFAFNASLSLMWSAVEVNVGMTCACIPTLKPLIIKILPAMIMDPRGSNGLSTEAKERDSMMVPNGRNSGIGASPVLSDQRVSLSPPSEARTWDSPGSRGGDYRRSGMLDVGPPHLASETQTSIDEHRRSTLHTLSNSMSHLSRQESAVYFGFVNMAKPKSMLRCSVSESWKYCTAVTVLFLLWGMSYGFLSALNNAVLLMIGMSTVQSLGLTSMYFGCGYFFGPLLVGEWILRRDEHHRTPSKRRKGKEGIGGFKVTFMVGLCFYGVGTIVFWPSAVTQSFGGLMLSHFVVGFGLSILETGANTFLVLCGPPEYADLRLMLAQTVQGIGSVIATVLATKVFFAGLEPESNWNSMTLINVQWTYLAITLACVILALFFYYMPLPEVSDSELDRTSKRLPVDPQKRSIGGFQLRTWTLLLAVVGLWTYMAAQEGASIFFRQLLASSLPAEKKQGANTSLDDERSLTNDKLPGLVMSIPDYLLIAQSGFAVSRFILAVILYKGLSNPRLPRPRTLLAICVSLSAIFALLSVVVRPSSPNLRAIPVILLYFTEGPCWPLIFSLGLRGQGRRTKRAAAFITMGGSGPAFFPFVMYAIIKRTDSVQLAYVVVAVLQFVTGVYPLFLMAMRDARSIVDPVVDNNGSTGRNGGQSNSNSNDDEEEEEESGPNGNGNGNGNGDGNGTVENVDEETPVAQLLRERHRKSRQSVTWAPGEKVAEYLKKLPGGFQKDTLVTAESTTTGESSAREEGKKLPAV
ncbi:hypothetical protein jhhlp_007593 [Lomentospora prolificans]|uniref:Rhodopsin domain-containing protein n=1 Tax=Lomentospora prolificans TaxID=41688 RepID=A0A2N3MZZ3_9PEZI|nr:hypothetical protein jhhlp_007593 [Lomentospora prolificans]